MNRITPPLLSLLLLQGALVAATPVVSRPSGAACTDRLYVGDLLDTDVAISQDAGETWVDVEPRVDSIDSIFAEGDNIYVTALDGLSVSGDGGRSWTRHFADAEHQRVTSVYAVNSRALATVESLDPPYNDSSLYISEDNGQTWTTEIKLPSPFGVLYTVCAVGDRIYVGTSNGLGISDDEGNTWQYVDHTRGLDSDDASFVAADGDNVYVGTLESSNLSISHDGGQTWRVKDTKVIKHVFLFSLFAADGSVYFGTNGGGLSISTDAGETWDVKTRRDGLNSDSIASVAAAGDNVYVCTDINSPILSVSRDGGETWTSERVQFHSGVLADYLMAVFVQCT